MPALTPMPVEGNGSRPVPESVLTAIARALRDDLPVADLFDEVVLEVSTALMSEGLRLGPSIAGELLPVRYSHYWISQGFTLCDGSLEQGLVLFLDVTLEDASASWTLRVAAGHRTALGLSMLGSLAYCVLRGLPGLMSEYAIGQRVRRPEPKEGAILLRDFASHFATLLGQSLQA